MSKETKPKRMCPTCGHRHRQGVFCHCFLEAAVDSDDEGDGAVGGGDDNDDEEEDEEEDDLLGTKVKKGPTFAKKEEMVQTLSTPFYVSAIKYTRCNCAQGVPLTREYEQVGHTMMCGPIVVKQYDDILKEIMTKPKLLTPEEEELIETTRQLARNRRHMEIVPLFMRFLREGHCNVVAMVSHTWNQAASAYEEYVDVRNMAPWQAYRLHKGCIYALCLNKPRVFSAGDKRILASDIMRGELEALITRDSGDVVHLSISQLGELYAASSNGSVRTYSLNHNPKMIKIQRTMWDHSRAITTVLMGVPSIGPCVAHGLDNHTCWMYTSSDDRTMRVWNLERYSGCRVIAPTVLRRNTLSCLAQSGRHIFGGTSNAQICVFTKFSECERDDVHACSTPGADKSYCLQVILKLPPLLMSSGLPPIVTAMKCTGYDYSFTHLWAGDSTGQMTVWFVPDSGIEFLPAKTWKGHKLSVNAFASTWKHMVTIGDDGMLMLYDLDTLALVRKMNVLELCNYRSLLPRPDIERRLKSVDIQEDQEQGGMMVVGTNYGDVICMSLGRMV